MAMNCRHQAPAGHDFYLATVVEGEKIRPQSCCLIVVKLIGYGSEELREKISGTFEAVHV